MSCLSWNCRGLGNFRAVHALQHLIYAHDPTIVFLCEMKSNARHMDRLRLELNFDRSFTINSRGSSGGLCVLWKDEITLSLRSYSLNHIDFNMGDPGEVTYWCLTVFYGYYVVSDRYKSWRLFDSLCSHKSRHWLCLGDFNETF